MTPDPDKQARDRFAILMGLRAGGGALILLGLWMLLGGSLGGAYGFGAVLLVMGFIGMIVIPQILARRWRTPR
jgi:hypothetical protein